MTKLGRIATAKKSISLTGFRRYIYFLLGYSLLVILWGAFVRISGSGDGCGANWPLCHGQIIPTESHLPMWIEYSHRLTSGIFGLMIFALMVWSFQKFPRGHMVRKLSLATFVITIVEALLGARLVLGGLVGDNDSVTRAYTMALHLANSMFLVGSLVLHIDAMKFPRPKFRFANASTKILSYVGVVTFLLIGCGGAIAALSTTLFPSESLFSGLANDFSRDSHFLVRVRITHPLMAILFGGLLYTLGLYFKSIAGMDRLLKNRAVAFQVLVLSGLAIGMITLFSLSPLVLKIVHLTWAYCIWTALLLCLSRTAIQNA